METTVVDQEVSILQTKIENVLNGKASRNQEVVNHIIEHGNMIEDFLAPIGMMNGKTPINFSANGHVRLNTPNDSYTMHPNAIVQAGARYDIATRYIKDLAYAKSEEEQWKRDLAAHILNEHNMNSREQTVLLRSVGGEVRAMLSNKYRRMSTPMIYNTFFDKAMKMGAVVADAHYSDLNTYAEMILPQVIQIPTEKNGMINVVAGLSIQNSDFGSGSLMVKFFTMNVVCLNGMTGRNALRSVHLGGRMDDNAIFSQRTFELDSQTQASAVDDIVSNLLQVSNIKRELETVQKAASIIVDPEKAILKLDKMGMLKSEVEDVQKRLIQSNPADGVVGESTVWKISQAVTAVSRDLGGERKRELDGLAGMFLEKETSK